jgi:periodic tryptophan protein 1
VKLTKEELAKIIKQTQSNIDDLEEEEAPKNQDDTDQVQNEAAEVEEEAGDDDKEFEKRYGLDTYDDEDPDASAALGLGNIVSFANPRDDPYLDNPDLEDDQSDVEDFAIKGTDNLILVGHVEGNASILEVYGNKPNVKPIVSSRRREVI